MVDTFEIKIDRVHVAMDQPLFIFEVELRNNESIWPKSFGSEEDLRHFLEGVKAAAAMLGHFITNPEIPENASYVLVPPEDGP